MELEAKEKSGVFVQKKVLVIGAIFFLVTIIVVAVLAHYATSNACISRKSSRNNLDETQSAPPKTQILTDIRLPNTIRPIYYDLCLQPFLNNFTFSGKVDIKIECLDVTDIIIIHANNLTLKNESIKLVSIDAHEVPRIISYDYDDKRQFLKFRLSKQLRPFEIYVLSLQFNGFLNEQLIGFYRSKYDGDKWMATTQFEPTEARRAFPCFDEPALKANFTVSLIRPKDLISISNMPQIENVDLGDNWIMDKYATTPKMSTYLLAFIVTKFSKTTSKAQSGTDFGVYSRAVAISQTKFASEFGPKVLDFYEGYFNVKYPLPKQDMIAIPDFGAGAMENWGLITYRETALLYDKNVSSIFNKERVAIVIAHELAHQWFGNLVSPNWWDYLWLNEGFAAYMERFATDKMIPKWRVMDRFQSIMHVVMKDDSLKSSHPVYVPVSNPDQINEIFDSISYKKGASIIRMMFHFLGEDVFKKGLTTYFNAKAYSVAVQDDLWKHMTIASNSKIDVKKVMDTWTLQLGYPVLSVVSNSQDQSITLSQKIFHLSPDNSSKSSDAKWQIPITFTTSAKADFSNIRPVKWMESTENIKLTANDGTPSVNEWIIVNIQQTGYYRVNYETENWKLITTQLKNPTEFTKIHALNRAQLIDDAFNLARAGLLNYEIALDLTNYLVHENEFIPWEAAVRGFAYISNMLYNTEAFGPWEKLMAKINEPQYNLYKFQDLEENDDNYIKISHQALFVGQACKYKVGDCEALCVSTYKKWISDPITNKLSTSLRGVILCTAIKKGGVNVWESIWEKYKTSNVESEKQSYLYSLTCTEEPWIIKKMLNMILHPNSDVRSQDAPSIASGLSNNKIGRYLLFDYLRGNIKALFEKFGVSFLMPKLIKAGLKKLNTQFELKQLKLFISEYYEILVSFDRTIKQIVEQTEMNIKWMDNNYLKIKSWLESQ